MVEVVVIHGGRLVDTNIDTLGTKVVDDFTAVGMHVLTT